MDPTIVRLLGKRTEPHTPVASQAANGLAARAYRFIAVLVAVAMGSADGESPRFTVLVEPVAQPSATTPGDSAVFPQSKVVTTVTPAHLNAPPYVDWAEVRASDLPMRVMVHSLVAWSALVDGCVLALLGTPGYRTLLLSEPRATTAEAFDPSTWGPFVRNGAAKLYASLELAFFGIGYGANAVHSVVTANGRVLAGRFFTPVDDSDTDAAIVIIDGIRALPVAHELEMKLLGSDWIGTPMADLQGRRVPIGNAAIGELVQQRSTISVHLTDVVVLTTIRSLNGSARAYMHVLPTATTAAWMAKRTSSLPPGLHVQTTPAQPRATRFLASAQAAAVAALSGATPTTAPPPTVTRALDMGSVSPVALKPVPVPKKRRADMTASERPALTQDELEAQYLDYCADMGIDPDMEISTPSHQQQQQQQPQQESPSRRARRDDEADAAAATAAAEALQVAAARAEAAAAKSAAAAATELRRYQARARINTAGLRLPIESYLLSDACAAELGEAGAAAQLAQLDLSRRDAERARQDAIAEQLARDDEDERLREAECDEDDGGELTVAERLRLAELEAWGEPDEEEEEEDEKEEQEKKEEGGNTDERGNAAAAAVAPVPAPTAPIEDNVQACDRPLSFILEAIRLHLAQ